MSDEQEVDTWLSTLPEQRSVAGRLLRLLIGPFGSALALSPPLILAWVLEAPALLVRVVMIATAGLALVGGLFAAALGDPLLRRLLIYVRRLPDT